LGSSSNQFDGQKAGRLEQLLNRKIPDSVRADMVKEVSAEEINKTIFSMKSSKAPGPNGFSAGLFQKAWPIIGEDVIVAIKSFFVSGNLLKEVNATIITLVPKKQNPSSMGDFQPKSCCNVVYKCIMKILANRLLPGLDSIVSNNQMAFISHHNIPENVLLVQELVRDYHRDNGSPRCTIKVDLMKAYDPVNWGFHLLRLLLCSGIPTHFVVWINECITNPQFSFAVNGTLVGYFEGKRGLRQGDPLSPYLFVIAMEVLYKLLEEATVQKKSYVYCSWVASMVKQQII
jgi:hypothetical protein